MSSEKELQELATGLVKSGARWFKGNRHYFKVLQAFIRHEGCCVYCGKNLWEVFDACIASCCDHLLPQSAYPLRAEDIENLVPACAECNAIKRDFDPSQEETNRIVITETTEITDKIRQQLIRNAQEQIKRKMNSDNWRNEFKIAKPLFDEAVAQYRNCKELAALK